MYARKSLKIQGNLCIEFYACAGENRRSVMNERVRQ